MIYEIRNYHFKPELFEDYKKWALSEAIPFLSTGLDLVGFWVNIPDQPSQFENGPADALGSANVTWIIRWKDRAERKKGYMAMSGPKWDDVISRVPGGMSSYLRTEAKFTEMLMDLRVSRDDPRPAPR